MSEPQQTPPQTPFRVAFLIQRKVIAALMIRDALRRFGHENLGFFWVIGEPLVLTLGVMAMWSLTGMHRDHGIGIVPFVLTGYSMLTLWRHLVSNLSVMVPVNISLIYHRHIKFLDIAIAHATLESLGTLAAFFVAWVPAYLLGFIGPINDPLLLVGGWLFMTWFAFGFGLVLCGVVTMAEPVHHFIQPVMYLILPLTGAFYMVSWLPQDFQRIVVWSPLVNAFEMFRDGVFGDRVTTVWDAPYLLMCCILVTAIGLPLLRAARDHMRTE